LFPDQLASFDGDVVEDRPNVVRSLGLDVAAIWRDYAHKVRKNVKRARSLNLRVVLDERGEHLDEFLQLYYSTLDRRQAESNYYFPREFFERLCSSLKSQFVFFHVFSGGAVVSTELVLVSQHNIYSFLGGTREEAFEMRPNDLLKHELILWGKRAGKRAYVLGGGYAIRDGVYRYKLGFAPSGAVPFRTGHIVFDPVAYDQLVEARRAWESDQCRPWQPRAGYFPAYRA
jgi:lipid II:glycine glycyltransferase (peptidoglycan interpeptide bridge formation enzyme)